MPGQAWWCACGRARRHAAPSSERCSNDDLGAARAGLLVAHAGVADAARAFQELWAGAALPPLMRAGVMEARLLHYHLLLYDDSAHVEGGFQRRAPPPARCAPGGPGPRLPRRRTRGGRAPRIPKTRCCDGPVLLPPALLVRAAILCFGDLGPHNQSG